MEADSGPTGDEERFESLLGGTPEASELGRLLASAGAPGRPAELAGLPDALLAFRAAQPVIEVSGVRRLRAVAGRHPRRAVTVVALIAGLSGVTSAAATGSLPRPVQQAAHDVLPILSIPAPARQLPATPRGTTGSPTARATASPIPTGFASAKSSFPAPAAASGRATPDDHVPGQNPSGSPSTGAPRAPGDVHSQHPGHGGPGENEPTGQPSATAISSQPSSGRGGSGESPGSGTGGSATGGPSAASAAQPSADGRGGGEGGGPQPSGQPSTSPTASPTPEVSQSEQPEPTESASSSSGHGGHH